MYVPTSTKGNVLDPNRSFELQLASTFCSFKSPVQAHVRMLTSPKTSCHGIVVALGNFTPVDDIPDGFQVVSLDILVLQVVRMLPHVHSQEGLQTLQSLDR